MCYIGFIPQPTQINQRGIGRGRKGNMQKPTYVHGYVRNKDKTQVTTPIDPIVYVLPAVVLFMFAVVLWPITLATAIGIVVLIIKRKWPQKALDVPEAEPIKAKRGYHRRLIVNHYQHGRVRF